MKLLIEYLREKHDQRNPEDIEAEKLNEYLCEIILSVKRKDGKDFEPSSSKNDHTHQAISTTVKLQELAINN